MAMEPGRRRRQDNAPTVLLQVRVDPDIFALVTEAAAASGAAKALYMQTLLRSLSEPAGHLPVLDLGRPQLEELPIPAA